jgi:signal transduction histidine kinase
MYGWWMDCWRSWWQESLSHSYSASQTAASEPSAPPSNACQNSASSYAEWPFEQALCELNEQLEICHTTPNFAQVTGLANLANTQEFLTLLRQDTRTHFLFTLQQAILQERNSLHPMLRVRLQSAPDRWLHISGMRRQGGVLLSLRDITHEMQLEKELVRARINAELAQRARSEFLGRMSHELRTPLNAVIGFSQMIDEQVSGPLGHPVYEDYLTNIRQSGEQLLDKINNLLAISEAELGEVEMQDGPVSLFDLLRNASEHHQHFAFTKDIQLTVQVDEGHCPRVRVDRGLMAKALSNLIENALAYTEPGGIVSLECATSERGEVLIHVCDTGIGMNEALVRALSEFFEGRYSSNNYYERVPLGTGLMLTREYVMMHEGSLEVKSMKGNGAIFTVRLPASRRIPHARTVVPVVAEKAFAL